MKIQMKDYEIEIKAKDTSESDRFNRFDTEYALNELSMVLIYACDIFSKSDDKFYNNFMKNRAREWYNAIDEAVNK